MSKYKPNEDAERIAVALDGILAELVKLNAKLDAAPVLRAQIPRPGSIIT